MSNFHADKARGFLNLAETKRTALFDDRAKSPIPDHRQRFDFAIRQDDIAALIAAAQVHATLATVHENEVFEAPQPEQDEASKDPDEPDQGEQDTVQSFIQGVDEVLDLLNSLRPVVHLIRVPRPVKDTPQA